MAKPWMDIQTPRGGRLDDLGGDEIKLLAAIIRLASPEIPKEAWDRVGDNRDLISGSLSLIELGLLRIQIKETPRGMKIRRTFPKGKDGIAEHFFNSVGTAGSA